MSDFKKQSLEATDETALDIVRAHGADEQADLVDAWVKAGNIAAVARVAREDDAPAPARKAARRGLNVLKARGLSVPEARHVVRPLAEKIERTLEARMMPPDGSGAAVFTVVARAVGRDVRVVDVVVVEGAGVVRCSGGSLSGGKLREWEKESERTRGFGPVTVDLAWVRSRVAEARKQNAKSGVLLPLELDGFDDLLAGAPEQAPPHPATTLGLELSPADAADRIARSLALHNLPELASYLPTREGLNDLLTKLGERIAQKGGEPSQEDFGKALDEEILAATDRFFTPDVRESLAARMLDAAVSVAARAGKEAAQDVLAVRDATLKAGLITQPPREIPFLTGFFQKAFSALARAGNGRVDIPMPARPQAAEGVPMLSADQLAAVKAAQAESSAGLRSPAGAR